MESNKVKVQTSVVLKGILDSQLESFMGTVTLSKQGNLSPLPFLHLWRWEVTTHSKDHQWAGHKREFLKCRPYAAKQSRDRDAYHLFPLPLHSLPDHPSSSFSSVKTRVAGPQLWFYPAHKVSLQVVAMPFGCLLMGDFRYCKNWVNSFDASVILLHSLVLPSMSWGSQRPRHPLQSGPDNDSLQKYPTTDHFDHNSISDV